MAFVAGNDLLVAVEMVDAGGSPVTATAISYRLLDAAGDPLHGLVSLTWTPGQPVNIPVASIHTTLPAGEFRGVRELELVCTTAAGQVIVNRTIVLEAAAGPLVVGVNTMVTVATADMLAEGMSDVHYWAAASRKQKTAALLTSYQAFGRVRFASICNLLDLSPAEIAALDQRFQSALRLAQIAQASFQIDPVNTSTREDGLVLETIGEVKKMFKSTPSAAVRRPLCPAAMTYLSRWTGSSSSRLLGRA